MGMYLCSHWLQSDLNRLFNKKESSALLFQAKTDKEADNIRNYRPTENSRRNYGKTGPAQIFITVSKMQNKYSFLDGQEATQSLNVLLSQHKRQLQDVTLLITLKHKYCFSICQLTPVCDVMWWRKAREYLHQQYPSLSFPNWFFF